MKYLIAAALGLLVAACATSEGYRQHMSQLIGRTQDVVLVEFGSPQELMAKSGGAFRQLVVSGASS